MGNGRAPAPRGKVYFAVFGKYVKIGFTTKEVEYRLKIIKGGRLIFPEDFNTQCTPRLIHTVAGCRIEDERTIQAMFADHHVAGEWYNYDASFKKQLKSLNYETHNDRRYRERLERRALKMAEDSNT